VTVAVMMFIERQVPNSWCKQNTTFRGQVGRA